MNYLFNLKPVVALLLSGYFSRAIAIAAFGCIVILSWMRKGLSGKTKRAEADTTEEPPLSHQLNFAARSHLFISIASGTILLITLVTIIYAIYPVPAFYPSPSERRVFTHLTVTPSTSLPSSATPTAASISTSTAVPIPTPIAGPIPTPTVASISTPIAVPPPTPTSTPTTSSIPRNGTLIMNDPLIANNLGYSWITGQNISGPQYPGDCEFTSNGLLFTAPHHFYLCLEHGFENLANFVLEVQITLQPDNIGGILLRNTGNQGYGYLVEMDPSGYYKMALAPGNVPLAGPAASSHITPGLTSYVVDVEASGSQITLYVNQTRIDSFTDQTYGQGRIGLYVAGFNNPNDPPVNTATFSNLKVWSM